MLARVTLEGRSPGYPVVAPSQQPHRSATSVIGQGADLRSTTPRQGHVRRVRWGRRDGFRSCASLSGIDSGRPAMTFDTRGGSRTMSRFAGAGVSTMLAQRCSGILYGVPLNRSRAVRSNLQPTWKVIAVPRSRVSTRGALRVDSSSRRWNVSADAQWFLPSGEFCDWFEMSRSLMRYLVVDDSNLSRQAVGRVASDRVGR